MTGEQACDTAGLTLPAGSCATVFADKLGKARHMAVTPTGDVFVAIEAEHQGGEGRVVALRDTNGDGIADVSTQVLASGGNGIAYVDGHLFVVSSERVVRYDLPRGSLVPVRPLLLVHDLPATGDRESKTVVVVGDDLFLELGTRAGSWKFSASMPQQALDAGKHLTAGMPDTGTQLPDGSLLIADHKVGRIWRVTAR